MIPLLFAQMPMNRSSAELLMMLIGSSVLFIFFAGLTLLVIRNGQLRFESEHAERMRALDMGLPVPPRDTSKAKALVCIAIGLGVPMVAYGATHMAFPSQSNPETIWIAASVASSCSAISASILGAILFTHRSGSTHSSDARLHTAVRKSSHDPDAIDVVGSRG